MPIRHSLTALFDFAEAPFEEVAYGWVCLFSAGLMLVGIPINWILGLPSWLNLILIAASGLYLGLFLEWRLRPAQKPRPFFMLTLTLLLLSVGWFGNGGLQGAVPVYYMAVFILGPIMLGGPKLWLFATLGLLHLGLLIGLEYQHPEWVHAYPSRLHGYLDLFAALSTVGLAMMGCVRMVQRAYIQEREKALAASQIKSQFLSRMSHELRTPLNVMIGLTQQLLKKQELPTERKQLYLERIHNSEIHLLTLVNELLDLSRIESGRLDLTLEVHDICAIIQAVAAQLEVQALHQQLQLRLDIPPQPVMLTTDRARLTQILLNLGGNAIKFTPAGEVVLGLKPHVNGWNITVDDTGLGIPAHQQPHIFAAFSRLTNTEQIEGTGLGLAISDAISTALGYSLSVSQRPGGGTRFSLFIPALKA